MFESKSRSSGHQRVDTSRTNMQGTFSSKVLKKYVHEFLQNFLHCIMSKAWERVPQPLSTVVHSQKSNNCSISIFCIWERWEGQPEVSIALMDDRVAYSWLKHMQAQASKHTRAQEQNILLLLGAMVRIVTDYRLKFTAKVVRNLTCGMGINHYLTTAYCGWANCTVGRLCEGVLRASKNTTVGVESALHKMAVILGGFKTTINQSLLKRLGKRWKKDMTHASALQ